MRHRKCAGLGGVGGRVSWARAESVHPLQATVDPATAPPSAP